MIFDLLIHRIYHTQDWILCTFCYFDSSLEIMKIASSHSHTKNNAYKFIVEYIINKQKYYAFKSWFYFLILIQYINSVTKTSHTTNRIS